MISPCVRICELSGDTCTGCGRSLDDIKNWSAMSEKERESWRDVNPMYYAGIGSRDTPAQETSRIEDFGGSLQKMGYTLRSGGAYKGADQAFEKNAQRKNIIVPERARPDQISFLSLPRDIQQRAMVLAEEHHPAWHNVKDIYSKRLLARNVTQVLGVDLSSPVDFVFFWAKKPVFSSQGLIVDCNGGTGLGVRLAASHGIPCIHTNTPAFSEFYNLVQALDFPGIHNYLQNLGQRPSTPKP